MQKPITMKKLLLGCLFTIACGHSFSQSCSTLNITHQSDIASACNKMVMTMMHDELNRPYLYVANKEAGLTVYNISTVATPSLVATVPISAYDSLEVMNMTQSGNYIYLALGNTFNTSKTGMAIIDVTNPVLPVMTDYWELPSSTSGAGIVKAEGNYAYLGAMGHGLVILDISNKSNIQFVSRFVPDKNFPPIANPDTTKINARGMEVKNSIVYLCHDAGGFRVIDCTNKLAPRETGHFCNPVMYTPLNHPRAYNNVVLHDTLAYLAVDYCGMEVLNIKDTSNITMVGWWNPYNCPNNNWFTSPVHTNELYLDPNCKHIFISSGKSDLHVLDVSDPAQPDSCNFYGGTSNAIGTWGVGVYQNQIYLSYICNPFAWPFPSNWTGVKILTYTPCATGIGESAEEGLAVYPVPATEKIIIESNANLNFSEISIVNTLGQTFYPSFRKSGNKTEVDVSGLNRGCYFLKVRSQDKEFTRKFVK